MFIYSGVLNECSKYKLHLALFSLVFPIKFFLNSMTSFCKHAFLILLSVGATTLLAQDISSTLETNNTLIDTNAINTLVDTNTNNTAPDTNFMEVVYVGDTNNVANPNTSLGAVSYPYAIGKYDVTATQYCAFLNAIARAQKDSQRLYNPKMGGITDGTNPTADAGDPKVACIQRSGTDGNYIYTVIPGREDFPITYVSFQMAACFCNWMQNGMPTGTAQDVLTGSYSMGFNITPTYSATNPTSATPTWVIPDQEMWYKAAYYNRDSGTNNSYYTYPAKYFSPPGNSLDPTTPNQANYCYNGVFAETNALVSNPRGPFLSPVGAFKASASPYGAYDMGGDVYQWTWPMNKNTGGTPLPYIVSNDTNGVAMINGCSWYSGNIGITYDNDAQAISIMNASSEIGFRVALLIPPATASNVEKAIAALKADPTQAFYAALNGWFGCSMADVLKNCLVTDPNSTEGLMQQALQRSGIVLGQQRDVIEQVNSHSALWKETAELLSNQAPKGSLGVLGEQTVQTNLQEVGYVLRATTSRTLSELTAFADVGVVEEAGFALVPMLGVCAVPLIVGAGAYLAYEYFEPLNGIAIGTSLSVHAAQDVWTACKMLGSALEWL